LTHGVVGLLVAYWCYYYSAASQYYVHAAYCYRRGNVVCRYVCLSVCQLRSWALQNGWTDRDALRGVDSGGPNEPFIRWSL